MVFSVFLLPCPDVDVHLTKQQTVQWSILVCVLVLVRVVASLQLCSGHCEQVCSKKKTSQAEHDGSFHATVLHMCWVQLASMFFWPNKLILR